MSIGLGGLVAPLRGEGGGGGRVSLHGIETGHTTNFNLIND